MLVISVVFLMLCLINMRIVTCACEKSFVVICDSLRDVQQNNSRNTWTELLVQPKFEGSSPKDTLTSQQLNSDLSNLEWLTINNQVDNTQKQPFTYCKNLRQLNLYGNNLKTIKSFTFVNFKDLLKLKLENNNIEEIQKFAFSSSRMEFVDLSYNNLDVLRGNSFKNCEVKILAVTHCKLWNIDGDLPSSLEVLRLDYNNLISLPGVIKNLNRLRELTISHNRLSHISDFSKLNSLSKLDLSFNEIAIVHQDLDELRNLKYLDMSGNKLEKFVFTSHFIQIIQNAGDDSFRLFLAYNTLRNLHLNHVTNTELIVTLSGNPWDCNCMKRMLEEIKINNIQQTACDQQMFGSGRNPYCVQDSDICSEGRVSTDLLHKFTKLHENRACDIFSDTDATVN